MFDNAPQPKSNTMNLTAEQAIAMIATWSDLTAPRRRDLTSALSSAAKLIGRPPGSVLLTPAALRTTLLSKSATDFGLEERRMRNILSGMRAVLRRAGVIDQADAPLAPAWTELMALMEHLKRPGLIGFARYCSAHGIEPGQMTDAVLQAFHTWLDERTITVRPAKAAGAVRAAWNKAASRVVGWPQVKLHTPRQRDQFILPLDAFPESFKADVQVFCDRLAGQSMDGFFADCEDGDGDGNGNGNDAKSSRSRFSRPISVKMRADHCRWAASALVATGVAVDDVTSLATLVSSTERVQRIVWFVYERAGKRPSAAAGHIADALRMIAKHHAKLPAAFTKQFSKIRKRAALKYVGMTDKNRRQVRLMMDPEHQIRLLELPLALMTAARELRRKAPQQAAAIALRALAIDLLTVCPIRLSNLIGIQLDRHLRRANPPRGPITDVYFREDEVKNHRVIDMPLPESTAALIHEWTNDYRPAIASPKCSYLFPGSGPGDRPITPQGMRDAIRQTTEKHVGVALTPHQFRHLAAHMHLEKYPGHYEEVSRLLGHSDPATTYNAYCGLDTKASVSRYAALVNERRSTLRADKASSTKTSAKVSKPPTTAGMAKPKKAASSRRSTKPPNATKRGGAS